MSLHFSLIRHFKIKGQMEHIELFYESIVSRSHHSLCLAKLFIICHPIILFFQVVIFNKNLILGYFQYLQT